MLHLMAFPSNAQESDERVTGEDNEDQWKGETSLTLTLKEFTFGTTRPMGHLHKHQLRCLRTYS